MGLKDGQPISRSRLTRLKANEIVLLYLYRYGVPTHNKMMLVQVWQGSSGVEHRPEQSGVAGSNPAPSTKVCLFVKGYYLRIVAFFVLDKLKMLTLVLSPFTNYLL